MSQDLTDLEAQLQPNQILALQCLLAGETMEAAAQAAAVRRETVSRWMTKDWAFQAAYNRAVRLMQQRAFNRLYGLVEAAIKEVDKAVQGGDTKAALTLLRGVGLLRGYSPRPGSDDPERLEAEAELADKRLHEQWLARMVENH